MLANTDIQTDAGPSDSTKRLVPENWSPEQETALLLDLCEAQMDAALRDADHSVDKLVSAFTQLVDSSRAIGALAKKMPATGSMEHELLLMHSDAITSQINDAVVAFQFYDKLSQRLGHVRHSLTTLAMFVCDRSRVQQREHWLKLITALRRLYRTAEERAVFDLVAEGATAEEVRASVREREPVENDVEFF
ncbi:MAG TPA: hypothetical protein VK629_09885 [Steroidobacteraceae bacterium]|nr:hypothetical protein [Steroidobacteraceae bacterium]